MPSSPAIERSRIETVATCAFIRTAEALLIQAPPGVGKTHFAVALGVKAVEHRFSAQFYWFDELKIVLKADAHLPQARLRRRKYLSTALLIVDELGFEPMSREEASLFLRLVIYRYGRRSLLITTNKSVRELDGNPGRRRGGHDRYPRSPAAQGPRHQHQGEKLPTQRPRERAE